MMHIFLCFWTFLLNHWKEKLQIMLISLPCFIIARCSRINVFILEIKKKKLLLLKLKVDCEEEIISNTRNAYL